MNYELCIISFQRLRYVLLTMGDTHFDAELIVYVLSQMLRGIYAAMLSASASEGEHERCKSSLQIARDMCVSQLIDRVEEG